MVFTRIVASLLCLNGVYDINEFIIDHVTVKHLSLAPLDGPTILAV